MDKDKDKDMADMRKVLEDLLKDHDKSGFNENLKMRFFGSKNQGITWTPVEQGKRFECFKCGNVATYFGLENQSKVFTCDTCVWMKEHK